MCLKLKEYLDPGLACGTIIKVFPGSFPLAEKDTRPTDRATASGQNSIFVSEN